MGRGTAVLRYGNSWEVGDAGGCFLCDCEEKSYTHFRDKLKGGWWVPVGRGQVGTAGYAKARQFPIVCACSKRLVGTSIHGRSILDIL